MVPEPASKHGPEFHRPAPNGLVGHVEPTFRQQAFHITIAQREPDSAFIYATVLEGAIRSQVNDGPVITYHAGESFSEFPGDRHAVSENASTTEPARLLAVFVVNTDQTTLTTPYEK